MHDIIIADNSNSSSKNICNFGETFKLPDGMTMGSEDANKYLTGSHMFKVKEIEVF
jgi:hypothetical protein